MIKLKEFLELYETPEFKNRILDPEKEGWTDYRLDYMSYSAVERIYDILEMQKYYRWEAGKIVIPAISKKKIMASAFIKYFNKHTKEMKLQLATKIMFYHPIPLSNLPSDIKNPLQIQRIYTGQEFEGHGIASYLIALLVKNGYTIISDEVEYLGGKMLWKKMARNAALFDYKINIFDTKNQQFIKNENNDIINYNSGNISDDEIWKENTIGRQRLLIMTEGA